MIKGFSQDKEQSLELISSLIRRVSGAETGVMMGANLANEIAENKFAETTIACRDIEVAKIFAQALESDNFRIQTSDDVSTVEACGALKNIVAVAAGLMDGLEAGHNTKAAIVRLGLREMREFCLLLDPKSRLETLLESAGVADLVTTCYGGRNRLVGEAFAKSDKSLEQLEQEMLNGQKLQGPQTADEVHRYLIQSGKESEFPLFVAVDKICKGQLAPDELIAQIYPPKQK